MAIIYGTNGNDVRIGTLLNDTFYLYSGRGERVCNGRRRNEFADKRLPGSHGGIGMQFNRVHAPSYERHCKKGNMLTNFRP